MNTPEESCRHRYEAGLVLAGPFPVSTLTSLAISWPDLAVSHSSTAGQHTYRNTTNPSTTLRTQANRSFSRPS